MLLLGMGGVVAGRGRGGDCGLGREGGKRWIGSRGGWIVLRGVAWSLWRVLRVT